MISEVGPHREYRCTQHTLQIEPGEYSQTCTELCRVVKGNGYWDKLWEWVLGETLGMDIESLLEMGLAMDRK